MNGHPQDKYGSAKQSSTDRIKDGNEGVPIKDSTLAKEMESLKNGPKVFIKATKLPMVEGIMVEIPKGPASSSLGVNTCEEQAAKEPDFIGDAFFYNLNKSAMQPELAGEYIIVYTRQVGTKLDTQRQSATIPPSSENKIVLVTEPPAETNAAGTEVGQLLASGHWAAAIINFKGMQCLVGCDKLPEKVSRFNRHICHAKVKLTDGDESKCDDNPFTGRKMIHEGSSISFGLKVIEDKMNLKRGKKEFWGFHFMKLEISCCKSDTGEAERHLLVAVRVPKDGNIASNFILRQPLRSYRDLWVVLSDETVEGLTDWIPYIINKINTEYMLRRPDWPPSYPGRLGLSPGSGIPAFQQYHLSFDDHVREINNLATWLNDFVTDMPPTCKTELVVRIVKEYWNIRYKAMRDDLHF